MSNEAKAFLKSSGLSILIGAVLVAYAIFVAPVQKMEAVSNASGTAYQTTGATVLTQADCNEVTFSPTTGYKFISGIVRNTGSTNDLLVKFSNTANDPFPIPPGAWFDWDSEFIVSSVITYCTGVSTTTYTITAIELKTQ